RNVTGVQTCALPIFKAMFGPSETGIIKENLKHPDHDKAIELYYESYDERHGELVRDNGDINELLLFLKKEDYTLGIVTGKAKRKIGRASCRERVKRS